MAVYYCYDDDGKLKSTSKDKSLTQGSYGHPDLSYYVERGDKVGAFLAQRDTTYPAHAPLEAYSYEARSEKPSCEPPLGACSVSSNTILRHKSAGENDSYNPHSQTGRAPYHETPIGYAGFAARSNKPLSHPDPEDIRHLHTLQGILPHIQPERKLDSLNGETMHIIEQTTGIVFSYHIPKKLLILFLGLTIVNKYTRTIEHENNKNCIGNTPFQVLSIPQGIGSKVAFRILVSWMIRSCRSHTMGQMRQFRVPQNTLAACTLAQVLNLFGLHKDALRVDHAIAKEHFKRPIFPLELEALWNCLGERNRYVYAVIKTVGQRLREYENDSTCQHPMWEEMTQLLNEYPTLNGRVRDLELNEEYRPTFGTKWCRNLGNRQV